MLKGLGVSAANGDVLMALEGCKELEWNCQGLSQNTDFLVLLLRGCELVLGIQRFLSWDLYYETFMP